MAPTPPSSPESDFDSPPPGAGIGSAPVGTFVPVANIRKQSHWSIGWGKGGAESDASDPLNSSNFRIEEAGGGAEPTLCD